MQACIMLHCCVTVFLRLTYKVKTEIACFELENFVAVQISNFLQMDFALLLPKAYASSETFSFKFMFPMH